MIKCFVLGLGFCALVFDFSGWWVGGRTPTSSHQHHHHFQFYDYNLNFILVRKIFFSVRDIYW